MPPPPDSLDFKISGFLTFRGSRKPLSFACRQGKLRGCFQNREEKHPGRTQRGPEQSTREVSIESEGSWRTVVLVVVVVIVVTLWRCWVEPRTAHAGYAGQALPGSSSQKAGSGHLSEKQQGKSKGGGGLR